MDIRSLMLQFSVSRYRMRGTKPLSYQAADDRFRLLFFEQFLQSYLKIVVLLYADDTVLLAENVNELHELLNEFHNYWKLWKLDANTDKSKIVIFGDRTRNHPDIIFDDKPLEVLDSFKYLGILLSKSRNFHKTKHHVAEQV